MQPPSPALDPVERALQRHEQQRRAGVGVISCLAGPIALAVAAWRRWCDAEDRPAVLLSNSDPLTTVVSWIDALARRHDLTRAAADVLAKQTGRSPAELWASLSAM